MKKITFSLLLFLAMVSGTYSQVQIGEGTNESQSAPFEPYFIFSYAQSIYLASEINASGSITGIKWYYSGTTAMPNSQQLVVYIGQTDKEVYDNATDFVDPTTLTQVYSGGITIPTPGTHGWVSITFSEPFVYDGISNLVIAVDENQPGPGYDSNSDEFHNTAVEGARSIWAYSDPINIDAMDPSNNLNAGPFDINRATASFVPNIIFEGIQQACANPTVLGVDNLTTVSASLKWAINPDITTYNVEYGESGFELGSGIATGTGVGNPYPISGLNAQTAYQFYVQSSCGSATSAWVGPYSFSTPCDPIADFSENFDEATTLPECWSKIVNTASPYAYANVVNYSSFSPSNNIELYNSDDAGAKLYIVSPNVTTMDDMRVKFRAYGSTGYTVEVGTMTNPSDPASFTIVGEPVSLTGSYLEYNRTLDGATGNFVAIRHGLGGTYRTIHVDNIIFEPVPTIVPECVTDANVTTNENCGNFSSLFEWSAVEGADGYRLTIGTTSGGNEVVDNQDLGNVVNYTFTGNHNTTYYYSLLAYNALGDAVGCSINSFSTAPDGCYCVSVPGPDMDNSGITNVQVGASDFSIELETYMDNTEAETVDLAREINSNVQITFATAYTYDTHIWIDFNDNFTFEANEKVFTGVSSATNPVVFNASFVMPADANLGTHRMRIGTADSGQATPNPCYNGNYGITLDFSVNIIPAPACLPPTGLFVDGIGANGATLNWVSDSAGYNVEYGEAGFELGGGTLVEGVTGNAATISSLEANMDYQFYVQSDCGDDVSPWTGPFSFTTLCDPFGEFTEDFNDTVSGTVTDCWSALKTSTSQYALAQVYNYQGEGYFELYNSDDANANLLVISPSLTDLPGNNYRAKFKAGGSNGYTLKVGTMTNPLDASTFTEVTTIVLTNNWVEYIVNFNTSATGTFVAFKHGLGGTYRTVVFDDFVWEPVPQVVPSCVEEVNITINEECGNFASLFEWEAAENADGYRVSIGTTAGGTDVVDDENIGNITAVNFTGDFNTTYYYTLTPFNVVGDAVGCVGGTFTTAATGCYCPSTPTSNDGLGITNIQLGDVDFTIGDVYYVDNSEEEPVAFSQNAEANLQITFFTNGFGTSYTYDSHVWIDFNDNYVFEASEKVFTGMSLAVSPTTLDASFMMPADATLGNHRMRIGTADSGQETPNPCYSEGYGVTVDFTVTIEEELSVNNFNNSNFKVYPNPVSSILNISYTQDITNVAVFNILGQEVITNNVNATQGKIDMSNLAIGTYLVKVTSGDQTKTIKVLKK